MQIIVFIMVWYDPIHIYFPQSQTKDFIINNALNQTLILYILFFCSNGPFYTSINRFPTFDKLKWRGHTWQT